MKHIFIINPVSGNGTSKLLIPVIETYFTNKEDYQIFLTEYPGHATKITSQFSIKDDVCVYAIGGDGTAFEVLNGLKDKVKMAIIPAGTGNDYYRMYQFTEEDLKKILINTIEGVDTQVDYAIANDRRFLNSSSMGLDAEINDLTNRYAKKYHIPLPIAYLVFALVKIFKPSKIEYEIEVNNQILKGEGLLIAMMNGSFYGGGFKPAPLASIQDGLFDIIIVQYINTLKIIPLLPRYFKGKHLKLKEIQFIRSDKVKLRVKKPILYGCDGETMTEDYIVFQLMKNALTLRVPKESVLNENREC